MTGKDSTNEPANDDTDHASHGQPRDIGAAVEALKQSLHSTNAVGREQTKARHDEIARHLLQQLTQEQKLALKSGQTDFWQGLGQMMQQGLSKAEIVAGGAELAGLPPLRYCEGSRGLAQPGATTFPVVMSRAATFDRELEQRVGAVIGAEARACGYTMIGAASGAILYFPQWGRAQECYGEDPFVAGEMGAALVSGLQRYALAVVKNLGALPLEDGKFSRETLLGNNAAQNVHLASYRRLLASGAASVMTSYNQVNGELCSQSQWLLQDVLRKNWRFEGIIVSPFLFGIRSAKLAALAGLDLEFPFRFLFAQELAPLLQDGSYTQEQLDLSCLRLLRQRVRLADLRAEPIRPGARAHRAIALEAAQKSLVLLKNEGSLLPLEHLSSLAVIGEAAGNALLGDEGASATQPAHAVTLLEALKAALFQKTLLKQDKGHDIERACRMAAAAEATVVFVGAKQGDEGEQVPDDLAVRFHQILPEAVGPDAQQARRSFTSQFNGEDNAAQAVQGGGDRAHLELSRHDKALLHALHGVQDNLIVVVVGGGPYLVSHWISKAKAVIWAGYGGQEGGLALAQVLLGQLSPSGRLPMTWPIREEDLPLPPASGKAVKLNERHGYRALEACGRRAAFPFGFGLGYTDIRYGPLLAKLVGTGNYQCLHLEFTLQNIGAYDCAEVVQLYVRAAEARIGEITRQLKGFERVRLLAGERRKVEMQLPISELATWHEESQGYVVERILYEIMIARHAEDEQALRCLMDLKDSSLLVESGELESS
ncbi:glycoside hydrolase family 3 C-terminal domain-containing protein [Polycladidibacter hongkongensis]|uniref:glycoside hydrolase family 3 C-terminal domain-containing protein n=1 Tax=Polycladidibacter hongkongensis TaxID=1647556 RepID=UPI000831C276|nr:glycoside hydrolase family 3 C-terminal domain-containing protein [Pseudovibrio hongkongensis]